MWHSFASMQLFLHSLYPSPFFLFLFLFLVLSRVIEQIDKSKTVKFVYLKYQPENVPPMQKAQISVLKGAIDQLFQVCYLDWMMDRLAGVYHVIDCHTFPNTFYTRHHVAISCGHLYQFQGGNF